MSELRVAEIHNPNDQTGGIEIDNNDNVSINGQGFPTDGALGNRNLVINGAMQIAQRGTAAVDVDVNSQQFWPVDRFWQFRSGGGGGIFQAQQVTDEVPNGFSHAVNLETTTADASLGTDGFYVSEYRVEGHDLAHLQWGTANAQDVMLSFWIRSNTAGTYTGAVHNGAQDRSFSFQYALAANTWTRVQIPITGCTDGTWEIGTATGMSIVIIAMGIGTDFSTPVANVNTWQNAADFGIAGSTFPIETNGHEIHFTGVQLEVGSVATPFEHRPIGTELALCQRYYQDLGANNMGLCMGTDPVYANSRTLGVEMRRTPDITATPGLGTGGTIAAINNNTIRQSGTHSGNTFLTECTLNAEF